MKIHHYSTNQMERERRKLKRGESKKELKKKLCLGLYLVWKPSKWRILGLTGDCIEDKI